jgi:hypothetical protein
VITVVFAALFLTLLAVLSVAAWHTRHRDGPGVPDREQGALTAWDPAQLREWTLELHHTDGSPPWPPAPIPTDGTQGDHGGARIRLVTHDDTALWAPRPQLPAPAAPPVVDAVGDLAGAADRIRALTLDEYEAALPAYPHHPSWYATLDPGGAA